MAQRSLHHAAAGHQPRQVGSEFPCRRDGLRCLLDVSTLLRSEEKELQFARGRQIKTLADKHLVALAHVPEGVVRPPNG